MTLFESLGAAGVLLGGAAVLGVWRLRARTLTTSMPSSSMPTMLVRGESPVLEGPAVIRATESSALLDALQVKLGMPDDVFDASVRPMIESYAAFVQCLPAKPEKDGDCVPILRRALRDAHAALDRRRNQILPLGVAPEDIGALAHRWSYAVMVIALLEIALVSLAQAAVTFRSADRAAPRRWMPAAGSLGAHHALAYRYEQVAEGGDEAGVLGFTLLHACVPPSVLAWLGGDARVFDGLSAVLSARSTPDAALLRSLLGTSSASTLEPIEVPVKGSEEDASESHPKSPSSPSLETRLPPAVRRGTDPRLDADTAAFLLWLKAVLGGGGIAVNAPDAPVHGVHEGLLLVAPQIFAVYASVQRVDPVSAAPISDTTAWRRTIQRGLAGVAGATPNVAFELYERGALVGRIAGIVLPNPERFGIDRPTVHAGLVEVASDLL